MRFVIACTTITYRSDRAHEVLLEGMQEHVMQCFAGGWSSFAEWINSVAQARGEYTYTMTETTVWFA